VPAADLMALPSQRVGELARAVERQLQVQLVEPAHQHKIALRQTLVERSTRSSD
jgi:hypothetical protein